LSEEKQRDINKAHNRQYDCICVILSVLNILYLVPIWAVYAYVNTFAASLCSIRSYFWCVLRGS